MPTIVQHLLDLSISQHWKVETNATTVELRGDHVVMPSSDDMSAALLQRYCDGSCTPEERASIEGNAELLARVATQRHEDVALRQLFAMAARAPTTADDWPSPQDLIAYVDGTLAESRCQFVEQCAERFPEIQAEIQLLRELGQNPLLSK